MGKLGRTMRFLTVATVITSLLVGFMTSEASGSKFLLVKLGSYGRQDAGTQLNQPTEATKDAKDASSTDGGFRGESEDEGSGEEAEEGSANDPKEESSIDDVVDTENFGFRFKVDKRHR